MLPNPQHLRVQGIFCIDSDFGTWVMIATIFRLIPLLGHGEIRSSQVMPPGDPFGLGCDASVGETVRTLAPALRVARAFLVDQGDLIPSQSQSHC